MSALCKETTRAACRLLAPLADLVCLLLHGVIEADLEASPAKAAKKLTGSPFQVCVVPEGTSDVVLLRSRQTRCTQLKLREFAGLGIHMEIK